MNLALVRDMFMSTGIFGTLYNEDKTFFLQTLEHAYAETADGIISNDMTYVPKVPPGTYKCVRGIHQLLHMAQPFETFEISGVEGHTDILFHTGNFQQDSQGCVLLGVERANHMVLKSKEAFEKFMDAQKGCDNFTLTII